VQALTTYIEQFGANGSCHGFHLKQAGECMTPATSEERNCFWLARKGLHLVVRALVAKGQSILLRT